MSDASGDHRDPHHIEMSEANNSTGGKLANRKDAGGVGVPPATSFSHTSEED
jgi:hypothetical protein